MNTRKKIALAVAAGFVIGSAPAGHAALTSSSPLISSTTLASVTASGLSGSDNTCWDYKRSERRFARKINGERTLDQVGKLRLDPELSKAARVHTRAMVRKNDLYHTPSDTLRKRVTNWTILGENVGVGNRVSSLHNAFMNSPAHRDNVLYPTFGHVGVGVLKKGGRMWVTIIFEAVANPGTTLPMPRC